MRIRGKGSKDRIVILNEDVAPVLRHYISTFRNDLLYNSKDLDNLKETIINNDSNGIFYIRNTYLQIT